jgi:hypothetical protein
LPVQIADSCDSRADLEARVDRPSGAIGPLLAPESSNTWTRKREFSVKAAARLSGIALSDWTGETRRLADYWREQPVVLVFIRHFG